MSNRKPLIGLLVLAGLLYASLPLAAQQRIPCADALEQAEALYRDGLLNDIPPLFAANGCFVDPPQGLKEKNTAKAKSERIRAYKLLTLVYIFKNDEENARRYLERLLSLNPEFVPDTAADPAELVFLFEEYETNPIFYLGLSAGINFVQVTTLQRYGVDDQAGTAGQPNYSSPGAFHLGVAAELPLSRRFSLSLQPMFVSQRFDYSQRLSFSQDLSFTTLTFSEKKNWIDLPIYFTYTFRGKDPYRKPSIVPYVYAGAAAQFLLSAKIDNIERLADDRNPDSPPVVQLTSNEKQEANVLPQRERFNAAVLAGAGVMFKVGFDYVTLDFRVSNSLLRVNDADRRYEDPNLVYLYGYLDDDFTQFSYLISVGFKKVFYRPRPKRK